MTARSRFRTIDMAYIALFAVLITVCAWIAVPFAVPFTFQTFAIFFTLATLGGRRGLYAVGVYLLLGAVGLPVFTGFQGGLGILLGTTGGYIIGFLMSALVFWAITAQLGRSLPVTALACLLGLIVCYLFGTVWFLTVYARTSGPIGLTAALSWCVFPFVIPDLLKLILALALSRRFKKYVK